MRNRILNKGLLLSALVLFVFGCNPQQSKEGDNKRGVKVGVSKYSPFGVGAKRIYDQDVFIPEKWSHLRPFFTETKKDKDRFARTSNTKEEIVYKVDENIQGYCIYTTYNPGIEHDICNDLSLYVSENGKDWRPVGSPPESNTEVLRKAVYEIKQPNDPEWVNVQYLGFFDIGGNYLKIQWNNQGGNIGSPQINRVEINYADSPYDGWKDMFIDECTDFNKTENHSENLHIDSSSPENHRSVIVYADNIALEQEIEYALDGGIDFFIWLMGEKDSPHTWAIDQYFTLSNYKDIGFCLELWHPSEFRKPGESSLVETWEEYCQRLSRYMSEPNYVTVLNNRPLFYTIDNISDANLEVLRKIVISAGFNNPYIVDAFWGKPGTLTADARSEYNGTNGFIADIWDYYATQDKLKIVPNFGTGMNDICRLDNPPYFGGSRGVNDGCIAAAERDAAVWGVDKPYLKPDEMREGLQEALDYVIENPESCEAQILTVFDWDSQTESGWICPGLAEDGSVERERLDIFKEVLVTGKPVPYERTRVDMGDNLVFNPGFEVNQTKRHRPVGWKTSLGETDDPLRVYAFVSGKGGYQSDLSGVFSYGTAYNITAYQEISAIPEGVYTLSATVKSSGNQHVAQMFIKGQGGDKGICDISKTEEWTKISIEDISITSGQCVIGFYTDAPSGEWLHFDDVKLKTKK